MLVCTECQARFEGEPGASILLCPDCNALLVPEKLVAMDKPAHELTFSEQILEPFRRGPAQLYEQVKQVPPQRLWPLAVLAEILDYHAGNFAGKLNELPVIQPAMFPLFSHRHQKEKTMKTLQSMIACVEEMYELFLHVLPYKSIPGFMSELFEWHEQINRLLDRLYSITEGIVRKRFANNSPAARMQMMCLELPHTLCVQLKHIANTLRARSRYTCEQLHRQPVEVTLIAGMFWKYHGFLLHGRPAKQ